MKCDTASDYASPSMPPAYVEGEEGEDGDGEAGADEVDDVKAGLPSQLDLVGDVHEARRVRTAGVVALTTPTRHSHHTPLHAAIPRGRPVYRIQRREGAKAQFSTTGGGQGLQISKFLVWEGQCSLLL